MQRYVGFGLLVLVAAGAALLTCALAQESGQPIMGTVTMYDGRTYTGEIKQAAFGIYEGVGIEKAADGGRGSFILKVGEEEKTIDALNVAKVEVAWVEPKEAEGKWSIDTMTLTTKGGEVIKGKPTWQLAASLLEVAGTTDTAPVHITAYPISRTTFSPKNLIVKIEVQGGAAAPGGTAPPGVVTAPPGGGEAAPGGGTAPPGGGEVAPGGGTTPPPVVGPIAPGEPVAVTLTLRCPKCGAPISVQIDAHAR